jgi:hypothetical protein
MPNPAGERYAVRKYRPIMGRRMCAVIPVLRRRYCGTNDPHHGTEHITFPNCQHMVSYCKPALDWMTQGFKDKGRKGGGVCPVCRRMSRWWYRSSVDTVASDL